MSEIVLNAELREHSRQALPSACATRGWSRASTTPAARRTSVSQVPAPSLDPLIFTSETHIIDLQLEDGSSRRSASCATCSSIRCRTVRCTSTFRD